MTAPTPKIEISGLFFPLERYYAEGHVMTAAEAVALDTMRGENLRSIFGKRIRALREEGQVPQEAALLPEWEALAAGYAFTRTVLRSSLDPIEKRTRELAADIADAALAAQGIKKASLAEGVFDRVIDKVLEQRPEIRTAAKEQIESSRALGATLNLAGLAKIRPCHAV